MKIVKLSKRTAFILLGLGLITLTCSLMAQPRPSRKQLCQDLAPRIPVSECLTMPDELAIVERAFPVGEKHLGEVKLLLGDYLYFERETRRPGFVEGYYLSSRWYHYILDYHSESYDFLYEQDGTLYHIDYFYD